MNSRRYVVQLDSGLGNQLFQYAFARALKERTGVECALDTSIYRRSKRRRYGLDRFAITLPEATPEEIAVATGRRTLLQRLFHLYAPPAEREMRKGPPRPSGTPPQEGNLREGNLATTGRIVLEGDGFDPNIFNEPAPCYFEGYWQTERHFADIADILRRELTFKDAHLYRETPAFRDVAAGESVAVHVRCGDYVEKPKVRAKFHLCTQEYYARALDAMRAHVPEATFVVFTENPEWVKANIPALRDFKFVTGRDEFEDLFLMSHCRHAIIPNSSFGWWGAWLGEWRGKRVITPERWHATLPYRDIVPERWQRLR